jgi:DNA-directed RNA polymerase specialized sigma subunit
MTKNNDEILLREIKAELQDIRKLLILYASKSGATSDQIGSVLGVGGSQIRNILSGASTAKDAKRKAKNKAGS